jgi:hypothetical protein
MSPHPVADPASVQPPSEHEERAKERLAELRRALQRQLRRKGTAIELAALDRAALMTLRAEMAALDPKASSNDIVRLDNAARRARADFERVARIQPKPPKGKRDMRAIEAELRAHAR